MDSAAVPPLSARLRKAREDAGLPQTLTAAAAGLDPSHLSRIERGLTTPTTATLLALAEVLELSDLAVVLRSYMTEPVAS